MDYGWCCRCDAEEGHASACKNPARYVTIGGLDASRIGAGWDGTTASYAAIGTRPSPQSGATGPIPTFYDEFLGAGGHIRPHWRSLADAVLAIGPSGLASRWQEGRRLIHEHGVTYNVYGDPQSTDRPWPLDPVPMLMDHREWAAIEAAVRAACDPAQRNPGRPLRTAVLAARRPAAARPDFPPSGFLRPCWGVPSAGGIHLHTYAADLARSPDGGWWVIADRTQAPSGAGYALENRLVSSRVLPDVFRAAQVRRLAIFFQAYRETLRSLVPGDNPRIVLADSRTLQRDFFRARLSGPLSRPDPGRRRRPDGARRPRISQDPGRSAAGGRDRTPPG